MNTTTYLRMSNSKKGLNNIRTLSVCFIRVFRWWLHPLLNVLLECYLFCSNWPTFPQVYMNGELVGGADIMLQMHQSGEDYCIYLHRK